MKSLLKLFFNYEASSAGVKGRSREAYAQQAKYLLDVWEENTYGLIRVTRLFLCAAQFIFPILLIRDIFGRWGMAGRRLAVEAYAIFKTIFPLMVIFFGWYQQRWVIFLVMYLLSETIVHILQFIFLADIHAAAVSFRRSLLMLFLHYAEVAFDFAVVYMAFDLLTRTMTPVTSLYFSIVATTTVGFGDISAKNTWGMIVVSAQLAVCVLFIVLFINYFSSQVHSNGEE